MSELRIVRQTSLATEKFTKDGKPTTVHVLLKDKPFLVEVGRNGNVDLRSAVVEANLFYDSPCKEVEWIKVQPFEYTAKVNADGSATTLECYIHILSSQNENALFRLRIRVSFPAGGKKKNNGANTSETLEIFSEPIQVISKPSVLRRKHERERAKHEEIVHASAASSSSSKRSRDDVLLDTLNEIKLQQAQQQRLLETIAAAATTTAVSPPSSPASPSTVSCDDNTPSIAVTPADSIRGTPTEHANESFEILLSNCIRAYNNLDRDSRAGKVRRVLREVGSSGTAFVEAVWSESFQREIDAQVGRIGLLISESAAATTTTLSNNWRLASSECAAAVEPDFDVLMPTAEQN